jgi:RecA-family ATPase
MELDEKLSYNIKRIKLDGFICVYEYKFRTNQWIEKIDDLSDMSSYTYDEIKQIAVDNLVDEFRISLNNVVFGDPSKGKPPSEYNSL